MKKLGLALSGGGARGFSNIGVIKLLIEKKIKVSYVAGTSMGSLVAAYYALYKDVVGLELMISEFNKSDLLALVDINDPRKSIIKGEKAREFLEKMFGDKTFEDTKIPLRIGATSLQTGESVVLSTGKLVDAILASGAYPVVFPPVKFKGQHLVDGALSEIIPVKIVSDMGSQAIIAVDLFCVKPQMARNFDDIVAVLERTLELMQSKLSSYDIMGYGKNILVLKPVTGQRLETFSFYNGKDKVTAGYLAAEKNYNKLIKLIK